ncbi:hypothetical protein KBD61_00260 [Patescibacteria group bacterium]|nr:hypothetical protein [Patescibacteria group bacterium]MBP9709443.1 hypothetical protein [Patescibacteria group bacterium]
MKKFFEGTPPGYEVRRSEREPTREVFMYRPRAQDEDEFVCRVGLREDGTVDLKDVPEEMCNSWNTCGIRVNIGNAKPVFPSQGAVFLELLITQGSNGYGAVFLKQKKTR